MGIIVFILIMLGGGLAYYSLNQLLGGNPSLDAARMGRNAHMKRPLTSPRVDLALLLIGILMVAAGIGIIVLGSVL